jgi:hypothetical protein
VFDSEKEGGWEVTEKKADVNVQERCNRLTVSILTTECRARVARANC